jgi:triphosphoribosyl-dephospho-CoA synthase
MQTALQSSRAVMRWPRGYARADELADRAVDALIAEAMLTPKPALVDRRGSGAHPDLNLSCMLRSARVLRDGFQRMAICARGRRVEMDLREQLARIGRAAEGRMLLATGGANSHRGAIWLLGLLVAAKAMSAPDTEVAELAATAAQIAQLPDRFAPSIDSHGQRVCQQYGVGGARGEAMAGFPHVIDVGLPALRYARRHGADAASAQLDALMAIMSSLDDTCLLYRGGRGALDAAKRGARAVLAAGGASTLTGRAALLQLDVQLVAMNASPGGCADLLAACIFMDG